MKIIHVRVKPNASQTRIVSETENEMTLEVAAHPENNRANIEIIKFLKKHFGTEVRILSGLKSKTKMVTVG